MKKNKLKKYTILKYLFKFKTNYFLLLILLILNTVISNINIFLTRNIIDSGLVDKNDTLLIKNITIVILFFILSLLLYTFISLLKVNTEQKLLNKLRLDVFNTTIYKSYNFFENKNAGELMIRIMDELKDIINFLLNTSINLIVTIGNIIFFSIMLINLDFKLSIIVLSIMLLFTILLYWSGKIIKKNEWKIVNENSITNNILNEHISNIKTILYLRIQNYSKNKFENQLNKMQGVIINYTNSCVIINNLLSIVSFIPVILLWIYGGFKVINGIMTLGTLVAISTYYQKLLTSIDSLKTFNKEYQRFKIILYRLNEIILEDNIINSEINTPLKQSEFENYKVNTFTINNLNFKYDKINIINNLNSNFKRGEIIKISGENASGKTTLVKLLCGLLHPTYGQIKINDKNIKEFNFDFLKKIIGIVPQDIDLFSETISENICIDTKYTIEDIIMLNNELDFKNINEKFLNKKILNKGINLSGGQKQKIAILRTLIRNPQILILDEVTSSLDKASKNMFYDYIYRNKERYLTFIISHDSDFEFDKEVKF